MPSLVRSDVAYAFPDDTALFAELDLAVGAGLTSLVGRNGAGRGRDCSQRSRLPRGANWWGWAT